MEALIVRVSCVILTRNEASNIEGCIRSASWCDEILVVDSESDDATRQLAAGLGARVIVRRFDTYSSQRQYAISQTTGDWVLMLDADERASQELGSEVRAAARAASPDVVAFDVPHREFILGMWMTHGGWWPQPHARLLRRGSVIFQGTVHEKIASGRSGRRLRHPILHFSHLTISHFLVKLDRYTSIEAADRFERGERTLSWKLVVIPPLYFVYKYFVQRGFLDGLRGFIIAVLMGVYRFVLLAKILTLSYHAERDPQVARTLDAHGIKPRRIE